MVHLLASEVRQLLHNKFVVILGDSVQRAVYKDLVLLLQKDCLLTLSQLKAKGEYSFEQDELVQGGKQGRMHNGTHYREVRQFCSGQHLVRFYFLTRVYSDYLEAILEELHSGEHDPDLVIMNSCLWDLTRYGEDSWPNYLQNLESLFGRLRQVLPESCLLVWNTAMPVGNNINSGFLPPELRPAASTLKTNVIEANFYSSAEAQKHGFDVLDLHFHFRRHTGKYLQPDGVHWNERAHRHLSQLLLAHVADAWGVELPQRDPVGKCIKDGPARAGPGRRLERQLPACRDQPAFPPPHRPLPLPGCCPLLPTPSPRPPQFPLLPPKPLPIPLQQVTPPFLVCPQDADFSSDHPFQSDQFSLNHFHSDILPSTQTEFAFDGDFMFSPQPPRLPFPQPCYQQRAPVVHRGFPRYCPRGPYLPWRGRPRNSKRRAPAYREPRPQ
ncbi:PC-esterase domain-containing protein 1B [Delphinapterus leucas]|uniref:PC-esterase domain-containing protein 1B n=1 Tax=Delphinapterus leucas TaxID=9749 RepID=A0A2Y9N9F4_DELLE|nr:PC-esterase domain-containing protein 1B [Delphinapterus leucas]XP_022428080.1 PC-esterase domain-containing protein 1B [Delphinapterus leucas]XP_022428081.1 PC-esterase domain-containing protein 1B [Delphinapterus leucas]XP_022428082.1 PC-esterase domain-containing protein 1B [Delphinapterus leucas]XP_022428083.1 PC-esterase domain-containing protein 1B [Delphinapterus leucas]XP_030618974.1 PC-esterase domain-containing protein 1B [Delphinapterus leucas]